MVQVTHEQLRPAIGIETWTPSPEDIRLLKKGDKLLKDGLWDDGRESGPPAKEPLEPAVHDPQAAAGSDDIVAGPLRDDGAEEQRYQLPVLSKDAAGEAQPLPLQQQDASTLPPGAVSQGQGPLEQPPQNIHVFSPRYQQQNIWQYGDGPEARPGRARSRSRGPAQTAPLTPQILPPTPSQPSTPRPPQTPRRRASLRQGQLADRGGGALQTSAPRTPKEPEPSRLPPVPSPLPQTPVPSDFPFSPEVPFSADVLGSAEYGSAEYGEAPLEDEPADNAADTTQAASVEPSGPKAATPPSSSRIADDGPPPQLPAKRPHDALQALKKKKDKKKATAVHSVLLSHFVLDELYEIYRLEDGWDGSPDYRLHSPCTAFRCCAAKVEDTEVSSDSSDSSDDDGASHASGLSRQERKAIDREIPWRTLMKEYPSDVISLYVKANRKEYDSWMSWNSIKALSKEEARRVLSDPILRKRVMPSRNAYREEQRSRTRSASKVQNCNPRVS